MAIELQTLDLDHKKAAAVAAYALARVEHDRLGYQTANAAFEDLGNMFGLPSATVKNFRDSFDPFTDSTRVGWHKQTKFRPSYLGEVYEHIKESGDSELIEAVKTLKTWLWLPDVDDAYEKCSKDLVGLTKIAEIKIPTAILQRLQNWLESKSSYEIVNVGDTALYVQSGDGNYSILPFAYLIQVQKIIPLIKAWSPYFKIANDLKPELQSIAATIAMKGGDKDTHIETVISNGSLTHTQIKNIWDQKYTGIDSNCEAWVDTIKKDRQDPKRLNKSIFKDLKNVGTLASLCKSVLGLEAAKAGPVDLYVQYLYETGDHLSELVGQSSRISPSLSMPDKPRNTIFYGAPGTGKSYKAERFVRCEPQHLHRVVFFADYQNSDFIGSLRPASVKNQDGTSSISYKFEKGPFILALEDAWKHPEKPITLLIEEINRGNSAAIFGEIFQLLDRGPNGASQYQVKIPEYLRDELDSISTKENGTISLPTNLFIVATMNNSDQGVFAMDTAFKRRFSFVYLPIDFNTKLSDPVFLERKVRVEEKKYSWIEFATTINSILLRGASVSEDKLLGPYFLSPSELQSESLDDLISEKVLIYIWEDVLRHGDRDIIFSTEISSFSELQKRAKSGENVFSENFLNELEITESKFLQTLSSDAQREETNEDD